MNNAPPLMQPIVAPGPETGDGISLRVIAATVLDSWWLVLAIIAVALLVGLYNAFTAVPLYQSTALVQVEPSSSGYSVNPQEQSLFGYSGYVQPGQISAEMEILKTRTLLSQVAQSLGLVINAGPIYYSDLAATLARRHTGAKVASPPFFVPGGKRYAWGGDKIGLSEFEVPPELEDTQFFIRAQADGAFTLLDKQRHSLGDGKLGSELVVPLAEGKSIKLIVATLLAHPGEEFYAVRQSLLTAARGLQGAVTVREEGDNTVISGSGVLAISVKSPDPKQAADITNGVALTYRQQNIDYLSQEAERKLQFLDAQLPKVRSDLQDAEEKLVALQTKAGPYQLSEGSKTILDASTALEEQISQVELEKADLGTELTEQHPIMAAANRKLDHLVEERNRINAQIAALPEAEARVLQVMRNVEVSRTLYGSLLDKSQELRIQKAGTVGNIRLLDDAVPATYSVEPKRMRMLINWALIGIALGIAAAYIRKHLNYKLEKLEDIERLFHLPVFAAIPYTDKQIGLDGRGKKGGASCLLSDLEPSNPAIEGIRSLRSCLHFAMAQSESNVIAITGPTAGVGKSFVSSNFANLVAETGKKVLLIDADLRRGRVHSYLGLERSPGLSELVTEQCSVEEACREAGKPGFTVLTTGKLPPNPAELVSTEKFTQFLANAAKRYDLVIIDTPPVLNLADPIVLCGLAGIVFLIIRSGHSGTADVEHSLKRLSNNKIRVEGVVFNALRPTLGSYVHPKYYSYVESYKAY